MTRLVEALRSVEHHLSCVETDDDAIAEDDSTDTVRIAAAKMEVSAALAAAEESERVRRQLAEALRGVKRMADFGTGPDTPPETVLTTISYYVAKKLAASDALDEEEA